MNENIDLTKILKDCPKGTKLYSIIYGEVEFDRIEKGNIYSIIFVTKRGNERTVTSDGKHYDYCDGDCTLFPSKGQKDWSKFKPKKNKFDPSTLQPFDKVLVRDSYVHKWGCALYSHTEEVGNSSYVYITENSAYKYCIPYNDDTKYLLGTRGEAPKYYRYWED